LQKSVIDPIFNMSATFEKKAASGFLADPQMWTQNVPGADTNDDSLKLVNGSRVAVIGGGPAGSMFSYFLLNALSLNSTQIELDIFEPRDFSFSGPAGCNHCGGIVSESLVQLLATEGIVLPNNVVQRSIDSYDLHMDIGSVKITTPLQEKRIAAIYRGNGPRNSELTSKVGLDRFLQDLAVERGARVVRKLVNKISWDDEKPIVHCPDGFHAQYDLTVLASGVNSTLMHVVEDLGLGFTAPQTVKTFISEYKLGAENVDSLLGSAMNVFLLDIPRLKFAAAIPKGDYVTVVMLGQNIDDDLVASFMNSEEVKQRFPNATIPQNACHCFPRINLKAAKQPYSDRLAIIGDAGVSRLYKDGIGAAYRTSKAAALTVANYGFSKADFSKYYWPACKRLNVDNAIGKMIFTFSNLIQISRFARRGVIRMTALEQSTPGRSRRMSGVLWDLFTGSAPYQDVLMRTIRPTFLAILVWNLIAGNWPGKQHHSQTSPAS